MRLFFKTFSHRTINESLCLSGISCGEFRHVLIVVWPHSGAVYGHDAVVMETSQQPRH